MKNYSPNNPHTQRPPSLEELNKTQNINQCNNRFISLEDKIDRQRISVGNSNNMKIHSKYSKYLNPVNLYRRIKNTYQNRTQESNNAFNQRYYPQNNQESEFWTKFKDRLKRFLRLFKK